MGGPPKPSPMPPPALFHVQSGPPPTRLRACMDAALSFLRPPVDARNAGQQQVLASVPQGHVVAWLRALSMPSLSLVFSRRPQGVGACLEPVSAATGCVQQGSRGCRVALSLPFIPHTLLHPP